MSFFFKIILVGILITPPFVGAETLATISTNPEKPIQGEPLLVTVQMTHGTSTVSSIYFDTKKLGVFTFNNKPRALYGIDLRKKVGTSTITVKLSDGTVVTKKIAIAARKRIEAPMGIPAALGGNTSAAATALVKSIAEENASIVGLRTGTHAFWTNSFVFPVAKPFVTDEYGYSRQTGSYELAHKGTDFRASIGEPVFSINRGVVRVAKETRNYGKTIIVDHGLGVQSIYMHLSKIDVKEGELVLRGQTMGLSGNTGYSNGAHLHISVRINDISIDPLKFIALFQ